METSDSVQLRNLFDFSPFFASSCSLRFLSSPVSPHPRPPLLCLSFFSFPSALIQSRPICLCILQRQAVYQATKCTHFLLSPTVIRSASRVQTTGANLGLRRGAPAVQFACPPRTPSTTTPPPRKTSQIPRHSSEE